MDIGCSPDEVVWCSSACEANSLALMGFMNAAPYMRFYTTKLEHASILEMVKRGVNKTVVFLNNDENGFVDLEDLETKLQEDYDECRSNLVSISFANSEIGTIQDIKKISEIVHKYGGILHVDATQLYPWQQINVKKLGIDMMSVSGQKLNCVKGIGFLYVRDGLYLRPLIYGSQQKGLRGGTMATHLIAAFGKALEVTRKRNMTSEISALRDELMGRLTQVKGVHLNGPVGQNYRLPNNISLTIDGVKAETLMTMCDMFDIAIAKGSACQSYEAKPSSTLTAIGLTTEQALNTVRISLGVLNTKEEIDYAADIITKLIERIREDEE
jgi:cysteine desulfurase